MENTPPLGIYPNNINDIPVPVPVPVPVDPIIINDKKISCCPPKIQHGNGMRRSWIAGTFLIDGSHLSKRHICASRINNTIFGPIHGKPVFVKNNLNIYGRYPGFSGGSGAPIRNKF